MTTLPVIFLALFITGIIIFFFRAFPFLVFSRHEPPKMLLFIEKFLPSMMIAVLLIYCLKDVKFSEAPFGLTHIAALLLTILLHLWKKNSMISIFGGTIFFMVLDKLF